MRALLPLALLILPGCYSLSDLSDQGILQEGAPGAEAAQPQGGVDDYDWAGVATPVLAPGATVLDGAPCVDSVDVVPGQDGLVVWTSCALDLGVGDVVVGTEGGGYLREITSVEAFADHLSLRTTQATLNQVLVDGGFDQVIPWEDEERGLWDFSGRTLYEGSPGGVDVSLVLSRALVRMNPDLRLSADFGWFSLKRADANLDVDFSLEAELAASVAGQAALDGEVELGSFRRPFEFAAGPVPVVGTLELDLVAVWAANADGEAHGTVGAEVVADAHLSGRYEDGRWDYRFDKRFEADPRGPDFHAAGHFDGKVTVRTRARVTLYGAGGPSFDLDPWVGVEADVACDELPWSVDAGLDAAVGLDLDLYVWETEKDFGPWSWDTQVAAGTLELPFSVGTDCGEGTGTCEPVATIACGQVIAGDTAGPEASADLPGYPVSVGNYDAPELVYLWEGGAGEVEFRFVDPHPTEVNHDLLILDGSSGTCQGGNAVALGFNSLRFRPEGPGPFYVVVDGYDGDAGAFQLELDCNP